MKKRLALAVLFMAAAMFAAVKSQPIHGPADGTPEPACPPEICR